MRISNEESSSVAIQQQVRRLKQSEEFEENHNNENYSDYVQYASGHARNSPVFTVCLVAVLMSAQSRHNRSPGSCLQHHGPNP